MPTTEYTRVDAGEGSRLPAGPILMRLRGLMVTALIAVFVYSALGGGSRAECVGGGTDADGAASASTCVNLTMRPSWVVYAAVGVVLFIAIGRVARRADSLPAAFRILDRAGIVIIAVTLASAVIALVWMFWVPLDAVRETGTVIAPFPFIAPDVTVTHQP